VPGSFEIRHQGWHNARLRLRYGFRNYTVKGWVRFAEVYGMSLGIGKCEPGASRVGYDALLKLVQKQGRGPIAREVQYTLIGSCQTFGALGKHFPTLVI
jgi:hypothetical protein